MLFSNPFTAFKAGWIAGRLGEHFAQKMTESEVIEMDKAYYHWYHQKVIQRMSECSTVKSGGKNGD